MVRKNLIISRLPSLINKNSEATVFFEKRFTFFTGLASKADKIKQKNKSTSSFFFNLNFSQKQPKDNFILYSTQQRKVLLTSFSFFTLRFLSLNFFRQER